MLQYLVFFGVILNLYGTYSYIKDTIKGNTKPNRVTWFIWSLAPLISSTVTFSEGIFLASIPIFLAGFCPLLIFLFSFLNKNSYWKLGKFDYICGIMSILALIVWGITKNPFYVVLLSIISDFFASLPIIIKSYKFPETESEFAFIAGFINAFSTFFAVKNISFIEVAFPLYLCIICGLVFVLIHFGKKKIGK